MSVTTSPRTRPATDKMIRYIASLIAERNPELHPQGDLTSVIGDAREDVMNGTLSFNDASILIEDLKRCPRRTTPAAEAITEGMYLHNGQVFKVQRAVHGSGNLYAKVLRRQDNGTGLDAYRTDLPTGTEWKFEYAPGAMRNLRPRDKMSLEQAKEWGALYGTCCVCGRTLTDEDSIAAGIGPVCGARL